MKSTASVVIASDSKDAEEEEEEEVVVEKVERDACTTSSSASSQVYSICRVCPLGFVDGAIRTSTILNHVELLSSGNAKDYTSWKLHKVFDNLAQIKSSKSSKEDQQQFSSQDEVWKEIQLKVNDFFLEKQSQLSIVAFGCPGSGKSFTLFGDSSYEKRGIVPRFVEGLFHGPKATTVTHVQLQMFIIWNDQIIDLLNPMKTFSCFGTFYEVDDAILDLVILPLKIFIGTTSAQCLKIISMGLTALSYLMANNGCIVNNCHIFLTMKLFSSTEKTIR